MAKSEISFRVIFFYSPCPNTYIVAEIIDENGAVITVASGEASKRSASYPALTPNEAYDFASKVNSKFSTQEVTRKEIGHALGVHNLSISRDVAAASAYGFLDKSLVKGEKDFKYNITQLFNDIFQYENENQKKLAYATAFGKPKLWRELISKFDGVVIPQELYNTLIKHHNITESCWQNSEPTSSFKIDLSIFFLT